MKIAIGSDKSGFSAKEAIKAYLAEAGVEFDDLGTQDLDHVVPYYAVANKVAPLVQSGEYDKAVLICGTGAGMSVVANKFKGVEMAVEMVKTFLATAWCQDLEDWRKENMKKFAVQVAAIEDSVYGK